MAEPYPFLRASVKVFRVLAWVVVVTQLVAIVGIILEGEPVLVWDLELPAWVVSLFNLVAAATYFFSLWLMGSLIQILLDIRRQGSAGATGASTSQGAA